MERNCYEGKLCYYSISGVCRNASEEEIRRAYRKLAMEKKKYDGNAFDERKELEAGEEKEQCSPVSVLDPVFQDEEGEDGMKKGRTMKITTIWNAVLHLYKN